MKVGATVVIRVPGKDHYGSPNYEKGTIITTAQSVRPERVYDDGDSSSLVNTLIVEVKTAKGLHWVKDDAVYALLEEKPAA